MIVKGIIDEDFINYYKPCMVIETPICKGFKCGSQVCQNVELATAPNIEINNSEIVNRYLSNPISEAIVFQGLEPFDSFDDLIELVNDFREKTDDDIVIYTGYDKEEIKDYLIFLEIYINIIIKYGRYIPGEKQTFDSTLGVYLASPNQYAEKIS